MFFHVFSLKLKWLGKSFNKNKILSQDFVNIAWIDKIFALIWRFVVSKKKKRVFGVFWNHFKLLKRVLKFVLIKDSDKNGGLVAWWDRFRFGYKTLKGVF
ncbi:hypothetical protein E5K58_06105 [Helicobacter pylori]|nr:hypothetical protein E5K58_06105 [Helicobacter pylori]